MRITLNIVLLAIANLATASFSMPSDGNLIPIRCVSFSVYYFPLFDYSNGFMNSPELALALPPLPGVRFPMEVIQAVLASVKTKTVQDLTVMTFVPAHHR